MNDDEPREVWKAENALDDLFDAVDGSRER
jgi:hypothetical protein